MCGNQPVFYWFRDLQQKPSSPEVLDCGSADTLLGIALLYFGQTLCGSFHAQ